MDDTITCESRDGLLVITLDRPQILNAAPPEVFTEIRIAVSQLRGARAVLLRGAGRAFCAGADISPDSATFSGDPGEAASAALRDHYNPCIVALAQLDVPIVSAVRGAAAGIGCSLALSADLCIASDTAYFLQAFGRIGLVCDEGASYHLTRLVGRARAMEMLLLGERVAAARALEWGLIHRVVADDALDGDALALAGQLAQGPTLAFGLTRRAALMALDADFETALDHEAEAQQIAGRSADASEGMAAFRAGRAAAFVGR